MNACLIVKPSRKWKMFSLTRITNVYHVLSQDYNVFSRLLDNEKILLHLRNFYFVNKDCSYSKFEYLFNIQIQWKCSFWNGLSNGSSHNFGRFNFYVKVLFGKCKQMLTFILCLPVWIGQTYLNQIVNWWFVYGFKAWSKSYQIHRYKFIFRCLFS